MISKIWNNALTQALINLALPVLGMYLVNSHPAIAAAVGSVIGGFGSYLAVPGGRK